MKLTIDTTGQTITREEGGQEQTAPLYSDQAFEWISREWVRVGWNQKYVYTFSWLGIPIIQLPSDLVRIQEVIHRVRPDVIIETGVAHGGSLVFYASLCKVLGTGRVIGVDIEIRPHNRRAIESHKLAEFIQLIEDDSVSQSALEGVRALLKPDETVLVLLDSCHTKKHVLAEMELYGPLVTPGSYLVAADGVMEDLHDVPRGQEIWRSDNPASAALEFARRHPEFVLDPPAWPFNESTFTKDITYFPGGWLRRQ
jgi:cephalosporin hydroxylase